MVWLEIWNFGGGGNSAEMLRSEEQQESFGACLYYSVFNLLCERGGSVLIKQS